MTGSSDPVIGIIVLSGPVDIPYCADQIIMTAIKDRISGSGGRIRWAAANCGGGGTEPDDLPPSARSRAAIACASGIRPPSRLVPVVRPAEHACVRSSYGRHDEPTVLNMSDVDLISCYKFYANRSGINAAQSQLAYTLDMIESGSRFLFFVPHSWN